MKKKTIAAAAIMLCAVMVLVAGAPLVSADTHHIAKGAQGPRASAVSWLYTPVENGLWHGHIVNSGLRSLVVDVNDVTGGTPSTILHQRIRFAAYPSDTLDTLNATMTKNRVYNITVIPNGPRQSFCDVMDVLVVSYPPVAVISATVNGATVSVDGSASFDPDGSVVAWAWDFGDGGTATGALATHTYLATGDYVITLTVMDVTGLTGSAQQTVHAVVLPPLMAAFTPSVSHLMVTVDASGSTGDITGYAWNWGDGSAMGSGVTASHTYAAPGTDTITLTVTDSGSNTNSVSHAVTLIDNPPVAVFTYTANKLIVNVDASLSSDDYGINAYAWNWGDLSTGTGITATHTYAAAGTYTIALTVTDTIGQTNSVSHAVTITNDVLQAAFTYTVSGATVSVNGSSSTSTAGITSYDWNFGDNITATGVTHSHYYMTTGTYSVTLTVTDSHGGKSSVTQSVHATNNNPPPFPYIVYGTTFATGGVTPLGGCSVSITDVRTGETLIGIVSDGSGVYSSDISILNLVSGDALAVHAVGPAGQIGTGTGVVDTGTPYLQIDVTLT